VVTEGRVVVSKIKRVNMFIGREGGTTLQVVVGHKEREAES
jgi:hypothetical protein